MYVPRASYKNTTNSLCVCAHLANKANSDSEINKKCIGIKGGTTCHHT